MLGFVIGLFLGAFGGYFMCALLTMSRISEIENVTDGKVEQLRAENTKLKMQLRQAQRSHDVAGVR